MPALTRAKHLQSDVIRSPQIYEFALVGIAYLLGAEISHAFSFPNEFSTLWIPNGVGIVALLYWPRRSWGVCLSSIAVANVISDVCFHDRELAVGAGFCCANALAMFAAALSVRFVCGDGFRLTSLHHVAVFFFACCVGAPGLASLLGAAVVHFAYGADYLDACRVWWASDAVGVLVISPLLLELIALRDGMTFGPRGAIVALGTMLILAGGVTH
ncbi:MAG: MASE1 domain-containing protein, partial [Planctomycetales bacterium]|nr:MASE1 domain-containing protein [Planctomycetales bacterium]